MKHNNFSLDTFRKDLKRSMLRAGYVQTDIAKEFGVSQGTISNFLSGRRGISGAAILKLLPFVYPSAFSLHVQPDSSAVPDGVGGTHGG